MNNWKALSTRDRQIEMVSCVESLRPAIYQIISNACDDIHNFDYYIDCCVDHDIVLMFDGCEFASANTDQFNNAGEFIAYIIEALNTYYKEEL